MRRILLILALILGSAAAGAAIGILITKSQLKTAQARIDDLNTQLRDARTQLEETIQAATAQKNSLVTELNASRNELSRLKADLARVRIQLQNTLRPAEAGSPPAAAQTQPAAPSPQPSASPAQTTSAPAAPGKGREYVVKEGDSFWKIAANELGSGIRYKEIQQLNPQVPPDKPLTIGLKLKLPAR